MMGYIECPKCGKEIDEICMSSEFSLDGREPTREELLEYVKDAKKWTEQKRVCQGYVPDDSGCGHIWTPSFSGGLIDDEQRHTRIYLSYAPGYFKELLKWQEGGVA
jgi:hypothetical protein